MTRAPSRKPKNEPASTSLVVSCATADLTGHTILIIEAKPAPFTARLQAAVERTGAQAILVLTPQAASDRIKRSRVSAAAVNVAHRASAEQLGILYVLYTPASQPSLIVAALKRLLRGP